MTPNGKISRLPSGIRDQLNRRLQNGEAGRRLVDWLNSLPETRQMLAASFGGRPINEPNLTAWKAGGYQLWLVRHETFAQARELAPAVQELSAAANGRLADHLASVLATRYALALADWDGEITDEFRRKLRTLRGLCQTVVQLQRGDHAATRLDLQQEQLNWKRSKLGDPGLDPPLENKGN